MQKLSVPMFKRNEYADFIKIYNAVLNKQEIHTCNIVKNCRRCQISLRLRFIRKGKYGIQ